MALELLVPPPLKRINVRLETVIEGELPIREEPLRNLMDVGSSQRGFVENSEGCEPIFLATLTLGFLVQDCP